MLLWSEYLKSSCGKSRNEHFFIDKSTMVRISSRLIETGNINPLGSLAIIMSRYPICVFFEIISANVIHVHFG